MDEDWGDWDHSEIVDLDVTGDPQLDQFGYQSPKQRGGTGFTSHQDEWVARSRAQRQRRRREGVRQNVAETRQRVAQRRGEKGVADLPHLSQPVRPALPPHVAQAVAQGMPGRDLGWWKVDVTPDGTAVWTRVDAPGDGPTITVEQTPAPQPRWAPVEQTQPSPGTRVW